MPLDGSGWSTGVLVVLVLDLGAGSHEYTFY